MIFSITEHFLGNIVNFVVVLFLGIIGVFLKKGIPDRINKAIMSVLGICVIYIGISGMLEEAPSVPDGCLVNAEIFKVLVMIISMSIGPVIGEAIDLDKWINKLGEFLGSKLGKIGKCENFARGFVGCSLILCVGAMTINGAIADAAGNPELLFAKSIIDGITVLVMAGTMGIGCVFSAFFQLLYQGSATLLATGLVTVVADSTLTYISVTGSLMIILLGLNVLGVTKVKTANMVPAMFVAIGVEALLKLIL